MEAISRWIAYLTVLVVLLAPIGAAAGDKSIVGEVVAISDGDTLTVLTPDKQQVKVRLAEIDTPERRQPYGSRSRQALSELVFREGVRVEVADTDRYGRTVGRIYRQRDNLDVNAELVRQGAAWVYREYNKDPSLLALEAQARQAERGLWALPEAERTPPWEWRRVQRRTSRPDAAQQPPLDSPSCSGKSLCREMASCEEAKHYLLSCGLNMRSMAWSNDCAHYRGTAPSTALRLHRARICCLCVASRTVRPYTLPRHPMGYVLMDKGRFLGIGPFSFEELEHAQRHLLRRRLQLLPRRP